MSAALNELIAAGTLVSDHRPWPRAMVSPEVWGAASDRLAEGSLTLLGLWGEADCVHMGLGDSVAGKAAIVSIDCSGGGFPSVGKFHPPAIRPERTITDLFGLIPEGAPDARAWLDHGTWVKRRPLGRGEAAAGADRGYSFLPVEGEGLHQIPVGPVHAGIIEPGHFRFTANGETVVRLEERLGYVHKGIEGLMAGAELDRAAKLAGRVSGDSTVAYAFAFARAVEAAMGIEAPARATWLRALMAELERLANHLGDIGAVCNDAAFAIMLAHFAVLRERVLRACDTCFGHRMMRDRVIPGGIVADVTSDGVAAIRDVVAEVERRLPALISLYDNTASLQDRTVSTGHLKAQFARQFGAGGFVGRASGRDFDARRSLGGYAPYDALDFEVPVRSDGDVNARVWIRIREAEQSLSLIGQLLDGLPAGDLAVPLPAPGSAGEGMALVEGFRGDILVWVKLNADHTIARCHLRDPSWFQWPLLEAVIEGNIVADFPLCNKSFNCSYSGHDL